MDEKAEVIGRKRNLGEKRRQGKSKGNPKDEKEFGG